ncbi:hypothetical protein K474DRAFT_1771178 [Panus rudis PR-1116 ss-1]|nr:hypothetical protein K474DRAFT_1771178 [Panus rudis PR-1116 ss-1]
MVQLSNTTRTMTEKQTGLQTPPSSQEATRARSAPGASAPFSAGASDESTQDEPDQTSTETIVATPGRCLITNMSVPSTSFVSQPVVSDDGMDDVEFLRLRQQWSLPLGPRQASIDTLGWNRLYLRADWALTFSKHAWTLIPEPSMLLDIIQKLISFKKHEVFAKPRDVLLNKQVVNPEQ